MFSKMKIFSKPKMTNSSLQTQSKKKMAIYSFGYGLDGQLGHSCVEEYLEKPTKIEAPFSFSFINCGATSSSAITDDGKLFTWGSNRECQLGIESSGWGWSEADEILSPKNVEDLNDYIITSVSMGWFHTLALTNMGSVFSWGSGFNGANGQPFTYNYTSPLKVSTLKSIQKISSGGIHSGAIDEAGHLYLWGSNFNSQIGNSTFHAELEPLMVLQDHKMYQVSCGSLHTLALDFDGTLFHFGKKYNLEAKPLDSCSPYSLESEFQSKKPKSFSKLENIIQISAGNNLNYALTKQGSVHFWTSDEFDKIHKIKGISGKVVSITAGGNNLACITESKDCYLLSKENKFEIPVLQKQNVEQVALGWDFGLLLVPDDEEETK